MTVPTLTMECSARCQQRFQFSVYKIRTVGYNAMQSLDSPAEATQSGCLFNDTEVCIDICISNSNAGKQAVSQHSALPTKHMPLCTSLLVDQRIKTEN